MSLAQHEARVFNDLAVEQIAFNLGELYSARICTVALETR
jgi:hypothetical protein